MMVGQSQTIQMRAIEFDIDNEAMGKGGLASDDVIKNKTVDIQDLHCLWVVYIYIYMTSSLRGEGF